MTGIGEILVLQELYGAPSGRKACRRRQRTCDSREVDRRRDTAGSLRQKAAQRVAQTITELRVEAETIRGRANRAGTIRVPVLRYLDSRRIGRAHRLRQVLAEFAAAIVLDHPHLVVADAVDAIFVQEEASIVDQELRNPLVPVCENLSAGPTLISEEQAVVQVAVGLAVIEPQAVIVEATAGMIVDKVEDHGDAVQMAEIDEALQLIDAGCELRRGQAGFSEGSKHPVDREQLTLQRVRRNHVIGLGRKVIDAIVAQAERCLELLHRQQLHGGYAEVAEVDELLRGIQEGTASRCSDVVASIVLRPPCADMQLIDDQVAELRRLPALVVPGIGGRVADHTKAVWKSRHDSQFAREGVTLPARAAEAVDEEHVRIAFAYPGQEAAPAAVAQRSQLVLRIGTPCRIRCRGQPNARDDKYGAGVRRPGAEAGALRRNGRAHGAGWICQGLVHCHSSLRSIRGSDPSSMLHGPPRAVPDAAPGDRKEAAYLPDIIEHITGKWVSPSLT